MTNRWAMKDPDGTYPPEQLQKIARRRTLLRWYGIIYSILIGVMVFGSWFAPAACERLTPFVVAFMWAAPLVIYALAVQIHGRAVGLVLTVLSWAAFVGIIVLIILNMQAKDILNKHAPAKSP